MVQSVHLAGIALLVGTIVLVDLHAEGNAVRVLKRVQPEQKRAAGQQHTEANSPQAAKILTKAGNQYGATKPRNPENVDCANDGITPGGLSEEGL